MRAGVHLARVWSWAAALGLLCAPGLPAFNLDVDKLTVYSGPEGSYFGYAVDFHLPAARTAGVLVGAPRANTSQPDIVEGGAVYYCPWPGSARCRQIPFDNTIRDTGRPQPGDQLLEALAPSRVLGSQQQTRGSQPPALEAHGQLPTLSAWRCETGSQRDSGKTNRSQGEVVWWVRNLPCSQPWIDFQAHILVRQALPGVTLDAEPGGGPHHCQAWPPNK